MSSLYKTTKSASRLIEQMHAPQNTKLISSIDGIITSFPLRSIDLLPSLFEKIFDIDDYKRWLDKQPKRVKDYLKSSASKKALISIRSIAFDLCSTSASLECKLLGNRKSPPKKRMKRSSETFSAAEYKPGMPEQEELALPNDSVLINITKIFQERLNEHRCPLYKAIKYNEITTAQDLIKQKRYERENLFQVFPKTETDFDCANRFVLLYKKGFQIDTAINVAAKFGREEIIKLLIKAGDDVNDVRKSQTPLMIAVQNNNLPLVKTLIELGSNPNITLMDDSIIGHTARHYTPEAMEILLSSPLVDPKLALSYENNYGQNLLNLAIQYRNQHEMVRYLIVNKGCDPLKPNIFERSALDYATTYGKRFGHMQNLITVQQILSKENNKPYELDPSLDQFNTQVKTLSVDFGDITIEQLDIDSVDMES